MHVFLHLILTLQAGPAASPNGADAPDDGRQILWQRSLEDALELQQRTGRPLLVAINTDAESASERIVRELYRDPAFVASTRAFVCLIASPFRHTPRDHGARGLRLEDPRFGEVTSGEALALEPVLFERFLGGERIAPRHALIAPDGAKRFDLSRLFDLAALERALEQAAGEAGGPLELEAAPGTALAGNAEQRGVQWAELARARSARNRLRFEELLARVDPALLPQALDAIGLHGDRGSLDALRVVLARSAREGERFRARCAAAARALSLGGPAAFVLWEQVHSLDARPGEPGLAREALVLPLLGELQRDLAGMEPIPHVPDPSLSGQGLRALLLSYQTLGAQGAGLEREQAALALAACLGAEELARVESTLEAAGGAFDLPSLWRYCASRRPPRTAAPPAEPARSEQELLAELDGIERASVETGPDPELSLRQARASLELARWRLAQGGSGADFLLEDALRAFDLARPALPDDARLRLEQARAAFHLGRFAEQERFALEALGLLEPPGRSPSQSAWQPWDQLVPREDQVVEAQRWLGAAAARRVLERLGGDPAEEALGLLRAGRSLALVAAGAEADETDWISLVSFLGAIGRRREELAFLCEGLARHPGSDGLRASLHSLGRATGRPDLVLEISRRLSLEHPSSGACAWYLGYSLVEAAQWHRRGEDPLSALEAYALADDAFQRSFELEPGYEESVLYYRALSALGSGFAYLLGEDRHRAALELVRAVALQPAIASVRDGLDREALDLLDGALEWRSAGPSPVDALDLLEALSAADPGSGAWAQAVSDSELREALRAEGRGASAAEVEACFERSIEAGRRALALDPGAQARRALAQALTMLAERRLSAPRPEVEPIRELLIEASDALEAQDQEELDRGLESLARLAAGLRERLGEARPLLRPGR